MISQSSKKSIVSIRVDGNTQKGLGHLYRCQALATMIKNDFNIFFYCREIPDELKKNIEETGVDVIKKDSETAFFDLLEGVDIVVLDGYDFSRSYQEKIVQSGCRLVLIDDLKSKEFCANLVINTAPGVHQEEYRKSEHCTAEPVFALGPDYALLRPAFLQTSVKRTSKKQEQTLLICFGGSDVKNLTKQALEVALDFKQFKKIIIITGSAYRHKKHLVWEFAEYNHIYFYHSVGDHKMAELFGEADVAIVPASGILYEALAMQTKTISGMYVDNQEYMYSGFKKLDAFIDAGTFTPEEIRNAIEHSGQFVPETIIDRKSPERVGKLFRKLIN